MIRFSCPKCETSLKTADEKAGTKLLCPDCGEKVDVPTESSAKNGTTAKTPATSPKKTAAATSGKSSKGLFVGLAVGACVLVAGGAFVIIQAAKDKPKTEVKNNTPAAPPVSTESPNPAPSVASAPAPTVLPTSPFANPTSQPTAPLTLPSLSPTPNKPTETQLVSAGQDKSPSISDLGTPEARDISNYLLGVTCWIVTFYKEDDGGPSGSGSLVDRENKLVLTNHHVVAEHMKKPGRPLLLFPVMERGKVIDEKDKYWKLVRRNEGISWHVEWYDKKKDLALIKLVEIPDGIKPVRIAKRSVERGERVHSMGNPGVSGALWVYSQGDVRAVYDKEWVSGNGNDISNHAARIVETSSPVNPGDSGGPMVNDRKELVAVTQGKVNQIAGSLVSIFVDVNEVRGFMKSYYDAKKIKPPFNLDADPTSSESNMNVAKLIKELDDTDPGRRAAAALFLARFGRDAKPAVDTLLKLLKDKDENVRKNAMEALEQIGGLTQRHLSPILNGLSDSNPEVRASALSAIRLLGGEAESAADKIAEILKNDKDPIVRRKAAGALGAINAAKTAVPALGAALKDESAGVRGDAAGSLAKLGAASVPVLKELGDALQDNQQEVRINSLKAIEAIGGEAKSVVPQIHKALKERDKDTRLAAVAAVAAIRAEDHDTIKCLIDLLEEKDYRAPVNDALVRIGKGTVPTLVREISNPKAPVRLGVVQALEQLGADAFRAIPTLVQRATADTDAEVRTAAAKAAETIRKKVTGR